MKLNFSSILKLLISFSIGIALIVWITRDLSEEDQQNIKQSFREADYFWIILSLFAGLISNISRAFRWQILLNSIGHRPSFPNTFMAVCISYLANSAFPRLGEVSRCGVLQRYEKIPMQVSFGTVVAERMVDMISLLVVAAITFALEFDTIQTVAQSYLWIPISQKVNHLLSHGNVGVALFIFLGFSVLGWFTLRYLSQRYLIFQKMRAIIFGFWEGLQSVGKIQKPVLFLFHSVLIWMMYGLMVYLATMCFQETKPLGVGASFVILTFGSVAMIITPGGIGAYPAIMQQLLPIYGVSHIISFSFGWISWGANTINIMIWGFLSVLILQWLNASRKLEPHV